MPIIRSFIHNVLLKTNHPKLGLVEPRVEGSGAGVLIHSLLCCARGSGKWFSYSPLTLQAEWAS